MAVVEQHRDLPIELADASLVVLSRRFGTRELLTLDEGYFRVLRGAEGKQAYRLAPPPSPSPSPPAPTLRARTSSEVNP